MPRRSEAPVAPAVMSEASTRSPSLPAAKRKRTYVPETSAHSTKKTSTCGSEEGMAGRRRPSRCVAKPRRGEGRTDCGYGGAVGRRGLQMGATDHELDDVADHADAHDDDGAEGIVKLEHADEAEPREYGRHRPEADGPRVVLRRGQQQRDEQQVEAERVGEVEDVGAVQRGRVVAHKGELRRVNGQAHSARVGDREAIEEGGGAKPGRWVERAR